MTDKAKANAAVLALRQPSPRPVRWEEALAVVTVRGDLDREGLEAIDFAVCRSSVEAGRVVLDLCEVSHLDYAGVALLVARRRELCGRGGELVIAVRSPYVANILRAAGGADLLLCRSVEEASGAVAVVTKVRAARRR